MLVEKFCVLVKRLAVRNEQTGELEKNGGVNVLAPDEMRILAILLLDLIHRLGGHG